MAVAGATTGARACMVGASRRAGMGGHDLPPACAISALLDLVLAPGAPVGPAGQIFFLKFGIFGAFMV